MGTYGLWGLLPIFFRLLHHVSPFELVSQRALWSLALILAILTVRSALGPLHAVLTNPRKLGALTLSALLIGVNWTSYVWAVNAGHVVAASLGYFLNPLVNVALGVIVFKERLRRGQVLALIVASAGVAIMAGAALTTLWISFVLALSFAFYALVRKLTPVPPMVGLGAETLILSPIAAAYIVWLSLHGQLSFGQDATTSGLLMLSGAVTTVPLVLFAIAAQRLSMATLGLMQYIAPTMQFLCGIFLFGEKLNGGQIISFALIWTGLVFFAADSLAAVRRNRPATA